MDGHVFAVAPRGVDGAVPLDWRVDHGANQWQVVTVPEQVRIGLLTRAGLLTDPAWREVFATVSRELFVPYFFTPWAARPGWRLVEGDDEWRHGVYTDEALVTQLNGAWTWHRA